jgi:hypothetical protein
VTEEPVRRYLDHTMANRAPLISGAQNTARAAGRRYEPFFDATILSVVTIA